MERNENSCEFSGSAMIGIVMAGESGVMTSNVAGDSGAMTVL